MSRISEVDWPLVGASVIRLRRILHRHPELSHHEFATTRFLRRVLQPLNGVTVQRISPTGLVARLKGALPGPVIALRADIDALPLIERNDVTWVSQRSGVMHACGHDGHTAMLLGALYLLWRQQSLLRGEVVFIFQAGEEMPPGGARALVDSGALDDVGEFIALHLDPLLPAGQMRIKPGIATAFRDTFTIHVQGQGGHSAMPHQCRDPLVASAALVGALQTVAAREVAPQAPAVVSLCSLLCGDGTIARLPDSAALCGTVRCFSPEVKQTIRQAITRISRDVCAALRCEATTAFADWDYQAVVNDVALSQRLIAVARNVPDLDNVWEASEPASVGEDFSEYQRVAPVCFCWLGVGAAGQNAPLHSQHFNPDERALRAGVQFYLAAVASLGNEPLAP